MVVADDNGPVKKKPRLSLKASKKNAPSTAEEVVKVACATPLDLNSNDSACGETQEVSAETESYVPFDGPLVPPVASLENLGNTCFLNSILQVLRYTPNFINGLSQLYNDIIMLEKAAKERLKQEALKEEIVEELDLSWELVKYLYKMYKDMDKNEERYSEIASADVTSMAIRPNKILDIIREFNPMFEGNFQHDAQELLRCLLCYLEDAEKALSVRYEELQPYIPDPAKKVNPIMKKFLLAGAKSKAEGNPNVKSETKRDLLDDVREDSKQIPVEKNLKRCRGKRSSESDLANEKADKTANRIGGRRRLSGGSNSESKSQPSVASMFTSTGGTKKRLGMRGAVVSPQGNSMSSQYASTDLNNNVDLMHDVNNNENSVLCRNLPLARSPIDLSNSLGKLSCDSPSSEADMKEACVRLSKCDRVCDSPLKSVSANEAIKSLNCNKRKREISLPVNKSPLRTVNATKLKVDIEASPAKRKMVFDEDATKAVHIRHSFSPVATSPKTLYLDSSLSPTAAIKDRLTSPLRRSPRRLDSPKKDQTQITPTKMSTAQVINKSPKPQKSPIISPRRQSPRFNKDLHMTSPNQQNISPRSVFKSPKLSISPSPAKRKVNFDLPPFKSETLSSCRKSPRKNTESSPQCSSAKIKKEPLLTNDFVEKLFQGTMMLRTKCIECEFSRERKEDFQDVSVPLRREKEEIDSDSESDGEVDDSCLSKLMAAFSEVERLKEDNKYFCENCFRYVEAERSLHYEVLPDVLTLHLKRFSASERSYGSLCKINDHITLPVTLPCLQYQCPRACNKPSHRYSLYGIVTHAGTTISSGHYLSYVKVNSNSTNEIKVEPDGPNAHLASQSATPFSTEWYECDDEAIRICSDEEFRQKLVGKDSSLMGTPYVLFYHRQNLMS